MSDTSADLNLIVSYLVIIAYCVFVVVIALVDLIEALRSARDTMRFIMREMRMEMWR
jgi:hypothetical protein